MKFYPKEICPRILLTDAMKREAEFYIFNSAVRGLLDEERINFPDACLDLDPSVPPDQCSETIDVKTQCRKERNAFVGLSIKESWWNSRSHDALYVAILERQRKNPPYAILDYAILGYAFKEEIDASIPRYGKKIDFKRGYRFIHFYDLHPINLLTPSSYGSSVTVRDRMREDYDV